MRLINVLILVLFASCMKAQSLQVIKFNDFEKLTQIQNDTTYVINFWATWCPPCVKELPNFEDAQVDYRNEKVKMVLISMDFVSKVEQVKDFLIRKQIKSTVLLMDEPKYNTWIDKVDSTWSGALPATIIINNQKKYKKFYEQEFERTELNEAIQKAIN